MWYGASCSCTSAGPGFADCPVACDVFGFEAVVRGALEGEGARYVAPPTEYNPSCVGPHHFYPTFNSPSFHCHAAEVAVDEETGRVIMSDRVHVEVIRDGVGNAWAAGWVDKRFEKIAPSHVVVQGPKGAPAVDIGEALEERGIPVSWAQGAHVTGSAVKFYDAVRDGMIVHIGQPGLDMAAQTAQLRYAGDGVFMWDRRKSALDVAPLVAVSMAYFFLVEDPDAGRRSAYEDDDAGLMVV